MSQGHLLFSVINGYRLSKTTAGTRVLVYAAE